MDITMYTRKTCYYCVRVKKLLQSKEMPYTEMDISNRDDPRQEMIERSSRYTVPQIFINSVAIAGHDGMVLLDEMGRLDVEGELESRNTADEALRPSVNSPP